MATAENIYLMSEDDFNKYDWAIAWPSDRGKTASIYRPNRTAKEVLYDAYDAGYEEPKWWQFWKGSVVFDYYDPGVLSGTGPTELSASEALFGFAGWLTSREERTVLSRIDDAAIICDLVAQYCIANNLAEPREGWDKRLVCPDDPLMDKRPPTGSQPLH